MPLIVLLPALFVLMTAAPQSPPPASSALNRIVAADRAFAAAMREIGMRDAFLTFLADDAVDIAPAGDRLAIVSMPERLRSQPLGPIPPVVWVERAPRWGAVSSAGDLGWLTGAYISRTAGSAEPDRHGAFFTIWQRQSDATFKVRLDIGISTAREVVFPDGFTPAPTPGPVPPATAGNPPTGITVAEASFAAAAARTPGSAYRTYLVDAARLHRHERSPFVGRDAAAAFVGSTYTRMGWTVLETGVAASADLAFAVGQYDADVAPEPGRPGTPERGFFVRVWQRDASGGWKVAFETNGIR